MSALRWRPLWLALGWGLIAAIWYLSLMPSPPQVDVQYSDKWGHLAAYFLLTFWWLQLYSRRLHQHRLALAFVVMGLTLEVLQGLGGVRFFEYADMAANTLGVVLAWLLGPTRLALGLYWLEARLGVRT